MKEERVTWSKAKPSAAGCSMGFLHPYVLFQHFKNTPLAHQCLFRWLVQSQHPAGLLSSKRWRGDGCQGGGHANTNPPLPTFYRLLYKLMYVVCPKWAKAFLCTENDVQTTHSAFAPFLRRLHPTLQHSFSPPSLTSSLIYILISRQAWPSMVTTFTLFFSSLCVISLCPEVHRSTAGREISKKIRHLLLYMMELRISVPFRFRHFIVFNWMRCILYSFRNGLF